MDVDGGRDLRCHCSRRPILARYGRSKTGETFIHIKSWKGKRLITEVVITSGEAMIHCRECFRWTRARIVEVTVESSISELPPEIRSSMLADQASA